MTTVDLKTNYKSNKVDLAITRAALARQQDKLAANEEKTAAYLQEMESLKAQLALLGQQKAPANTTATASAIVRSGSNEIPPTPIPSDAAAPPRVKFALTQQEWDKTV